MGAAWQGQLDDLVNRRWDPRKGVGPRMGRCRAVLTAAFLGAVVFARFIPISVYGLHLGSLLFWCIASALIVIWLLPVVIRARTRRLYREHAGFLCPWCRYPLSGLGERGRCPECGSGFRADACRTLYDCAYRAFQPDQVALKQRERLAWKQALEERDRGED